MNKIGIIGGSGLYDIEGLEVKEKRTVDTPFGKPSDEITIGELAGRECLFLPRHSTKHSIMPSEINFRANIYALKVLGASRVVSVTAVGSLKEEVAPLDVLLVDQFVDRTNQARPTTFFGEGIVAHIPFAEPICSELREMIYEVNGDLDVKVHEKGTYINMEGPAFSTKAESFLYKSWGIDVIGMTNMAEARLAREAGICYATIALVTDYDCWHESEEDVSTDMILDNMRKNIAVAKKMIVNTIKNMPDECTCGCANTLAGSIVTRKEDVSQDVLDKLAPIIEGFI